MNDIIKAHGNNIYKLLVTTLTVVIFFLMKGCGNDGGRDEDPVPENILAGKTLTLISVNVDGIDKTNSYSGLVLKFEEASYQSTNGYPFFNPIGLWRILSTINMIEFDGAVQSELTVVSEDVLRLTFEWEETIFGEGRLSSVEGTYQLDFRLAD